MFVTHNMTGAIISRLVFMVTCWCLGLSPLFVVGTIKRSILLSLTCVTQHTSLPPRSNTYSLLSLLSSLCSSQYSYAHRHPREQAFKITMSAANLHGWWAIMVFGSAKFCVTAHCSMTFRHALQYIVVRLLPDIPIHCTYYFLVNVRDTAL